MNTAGANEYGLVDERLYPLVFDLLARINALLASAIAGVPYVDAREAMRSSRDEEAELAGAIEKVVIAHAAVFAEYKEIVELGVAFMAIRAARLDQALCRTPGDQPLTWKECVVGLLTVLAPLLIPLAIYLLNLSVTKLRR